MPRRRSRSTYQSYSSGYGRREKQRKIPSPLPYLLVALLAGAGLAYFQFFTFQTLTGKVTNAYTNAPVPSVQVTMRSGSSPSGTPQASAASALTSTTSLDGSFTFQKLPERPVISISADGYAPQTIDADGKRDVQIRLVPNVLSGQVLATDGKPVAGAQIFAGGARTSSGSDGKYLLKDLPTDRKLLVKAPGYLPTTIQFGQVVTQNVKLDPFVARAIYLSADTVATPGKLRALLDLVDRTELNAVVIDVKADNTGAILYDSRLPIVEELDTANPIISDLDRLLAQLKERKIYAIARLPAFWDQVVTAARPEWALKSKKAPGTAWVDGNGRRWANPHNPQVWDYNIQVAKEVAQRGFSEVQFDNAHFPSTGELEDIDYGPEGAGKKRVDGISGFLEKAYAELSPMGIYVGINVFALTPYVQDDQGVGHYFEALAPNCDYICPTVYPSDFPEGFLEFPDPSEHPADIVTATMKNAARRSAAITAPARVRPWLQDFSRKVPYDAPKVRAQIDAAEQNGAVGWMLWNFNNVYTEGAFKAP